MPTQIFGAELLRRGPDGLTIGVALAMLGAITAFTLAIIPFAAAAAIRVNLR